MSCLSSAELREGTMGLQDGILCCLELSFGWLFVGAVCNCGRSSLMGWGAERERECEFAELGRVAEDEAEGVALS